MSAGYAQEASTEQGKDASYSALADLLEDREMRERLIEQLRSQAQPPSEESSSAPQAEDELQADGGYNETWVETVPDALQQFAVDIHSDLFETWQVLKAFAMGHPVMAERPQVWRPALFSLAVAIVSALLAYLVLRLIARSAFRRLNDWATRDDGKPLNQNPIAQRGRQPWRRLHLGHKLMAIIGAFVLDVVVIVLAALAAYAMVIVFSSPDEGVTLYAMQFLTAFVSIEGAKSVSRAIFATRYDRLRLLPLSEQTADYWNRWISILIALTGYSLMVIVPVVQSMLSHSVGELLGLVLMLMVYIYAITVIWQNRHQVSTGLREYAQKTSAQVFGTLMRILARSWHWILLAYFTILLVVSQADQQHALDFMLRATLQSGIAVMIGALFASALTALLDRQIHLPDNWHKALPMLETRINAYVPAFLKGLRLLILIVVALVLLDAWKVFDLVGWLGSDHGRQSVGTLMRVGIVLLIAAILWTVLASVIEHRLGVTAGKHRPTEREKTLLMLFRSAASAVIATMTVLIVLSQIGVDIGPLIAGAGVVGLAIGFGAQKLVQDVITGIFIQLENGMNQNDTVEVVGLFGTVEKITIRSVVIRTLDGGYHLIPFSTIDKVSNHTRDYGYHYGEYNIAYRSNVDDAIAQLKLAFEELKQDPEVASAILEDISIPGVTSLSQRGFTIRVLIKTAPGMQWAVQRAFNRLVKTYFDAAGIELPYPQTVLHFGRDGDGHAQPGDARAVEALRHLVKQPAGGEQPSRTALSQAQPRADQPSSDKPDEEQR